MSWATIVGQSLAVRLLSRAVATGKVAHAYLFVGSDGVGKRTVALELAKALNCLDSSPREGACDRCVSCRKISANPPTHPDLIVVEPDGKFIKTDQVRQLQAEIYARPTEGKVRVAVINGADKMNPESGNRVLKLLEEPPAHAVLILLAHNLAGVLPTLISRCQVVSFPPLNTGDVARALESQLGVEAEQARLFAALSGGSIGRAVQMAQDPAVSQWRDETGELIAKLHQMDDLDLLGQAEALDKQRDHIDDWLELLTVWLRDALLVAQTGAEALVINADRLPAVRDVASRLGPSRLLDMLSAVTDARSRLQRYANVRLVLDVLFLQLGDAARS